MQRGGWQNAGNPNMAPLPNRPGIGAGAGMGFAGPPPGMMMNRPPPMGPAAGGAGMPAVNPGWAQRAAEIGRGGTEVATTLFVGSISPGVGDDWLKQLLSACGPLTSLKRVNATFGFATFMDADGVLRALESLNGLELPAMGPNAVASEAKSLVVKADEKTKKFLAEFEKGRVVGETERAAADVTSEAVASILSRMRDPSSQQGPDASISTLNVPSHLKDLPPEDLPEEHRGSVLSEIDKFRQASAAREEEKRRRERVMEIERRSGNGWGPNAGGEGNATGANGAQAQQGMGAHGAQSYQKPVSFVASTQPSADPVARDEEEEKRRKAHVLETEKRSAEEAERRYIAAERRRFEHWEHEDKKEKLDAEDRVQRASAFITRMQSWDDEAEREREMFYVDRTRWKHYRATARQREQEADEADRRAELAEIENAKTAAQRAAEQAAAAQVAHAEAQRAAGVLLPGAGVHAPLRLKVAPPEAAPKEAPAQAPRGVLGEADDEVGASKKKLRKIELGDGLSEAQREELRKTHAVKVEESLPREREALFNTAPAWNWVDETAIVRTYRPLIDSFIADSVGEAVPELAEAFVDALRRKAKAPALVQVLEPVLDDEAAQCVEKFWRRLVVDTLSLSAVAAVKEA